MWIIIEESIGIICACLPMYRRPLSIVFPTLFPSHNVSQRTTAQFSHVVSGKNEWVPSTDNRQTIPMASINITSEDHDSEEYILQDDHKSVLKGDSGIRKVTNFSVRYRS